MSEVRAIRLLPREGSQNAEMIPDPRAPGEFHFETVGYDACHPSDIPPGAEGRLIYFCPRGRGLCGGISIGNGFKPGAGRPSWTWDGNADAPTLTPSIDCQGGCGWHGYLTAGVFK